MCAHTNVNTHLWYMITVHIFMHVHTNIVCPYMHTFMVELNTGAYLEYVIP